MVSISEDAATGSERGSIRKVAKGFLELAATMGLYSKDPALRRSAQNYMALDAKRSLEEIADGVSASRTPAADSAVREVPPEPEDWFSKVARLMRDTQRLVHEPPAENDLNVYRSFVLGRGLRGEGGTFGLGACHVGGAAAVAEAGMGVGDDARASILRRKLLESQGESAGEVPVASLAAEWADATGPEAIDVLPGLLAEDRAGYRRTSLELLTNPGASFVVRPPGISEAQADNCWKFGYALAALRSGQRHAAGA